MADPMESLATALALFVGWINKNIKSVSRLKQTTKRMLLLGLATGVSTLVGMLLQREAQSRQKILVIEAAVTEVYTEFWNRNKRRINNNNNNNNNNKKRRVCRHDHARAWMCIQQDYLGPEPIFLDKQFEEVYRLTKSAVEKLITACCKYQPGYFGRNRADATGKSAIRVECKVLGILKCVAFGCSGVAFRDYHQMARNTFSENLKAFFRAILADPELSERYLRAPTREDATRVVALHKKKHKVNGLLGGIDCFHWMWKNCPVGQQCHYKNGKNKMSSVVLEAMVDYNTWFWHASFGHPGTNNDINVWDVSDLQKQFLSNEFNDTVDFDFEIDGKKFNKLWCLVDGIYPPISRFVKTIPVPVGETMKKFVKWQESARKDVERAFGIIVRKFQVLARPVEYWFVDDIKDQMYGCILMHNMMVEERMLRNERESENMYAVSPLQEASIKEAVVAAAAKKKPKTTASGLEEHVRSNLGLRPPPEYIETQVDVQIERWKALHNEKEHIRLQTAVMNHLARDFITYKEKKKKGLQKQHEGIQQGVDPA